MWKALEQKRTKKKWEQLGLHIVFVCAVSTHFLHCSYSWRSLRFSSFFLFLLFQMVCIITKSVFPLLLGFILLYFVCVCHLLLFVFYSSALTQTGFSELWWMVIGFYQLKISIASHSFYSDPDPIQYSLVCRRSCGQYCECLGDRGGGTQYTCYPRSVNKRIIPIGNNRLCCPWYIE